MIPFIIERRDAAEFPLVVALMIGVVQLLIGLIFLIPPILGAIFFICEVYGMDGNIISLNRLSGNWTGDSGAMSAAPIYLGLMALAGSFIIHSAVKNFILSHFTDFKIKVREPNKYE